MADFLQHILLYPVSIKSTVFPKGRGREAFTRSDQRQVLVGGAMQYVPTHLVPVQAAIPPVQW